MRYFTVHYPLFLTRNKTALPIYLRPHRVYYIARELLNAIEKLFQRSRYQRTHTRSYIGLVFKQTR